MPKNKTKSPSKTDLNFFSAKFQKRTIETGNIASKLTQRADINVPGALSNRLNPSSPLSQDSEYYHINKIGYKNYKYVKIKEAPSDPTKTNLIALKKRDTLETCIQSIYEQKIYIQPEVQGELLDHLFANQVLKDKVIAKRPDFENHVNSRHDSPKVVEVVDINEMIENEERGQLTNKELMKKKILEEKRQEQLVKLGKFADDSYEIDEEQRKIIEIKRKVPNPIKREYSPNFTGIIVNKKGSFKNKQLRHEFAYYADVTRKYLTLKRSQLVNKESQDLLLHDYKVKWLEKSMYLLVSFIDNVN